MRLISSSANLLPTYTPSSPGDHYHQHIHKSPDSSLSIRSPTHPSQNINQLSHAHKNLVIHAPLTTIYSSTFFRKKWTRRCTTQSRSRWRHSSRTRTTHPTPTSSASAGTSPTLCCCSGPKTSWQKRCQRYEWPSHLVFKLDQHLIPSCKRFEICDRIDSFYYIAMTGM